MLDIKFIRENPDLIVKKSKEKGVDVDIDQILQADAKRKELELINADNKLVEDNSIIEDESQSAEESYIDEYANNSEFDNNEYNSGNEGNYSD